MNSVGLPSPIHTEIIKCCFFNSDDVEMLGEDEEPPALLLEDSATTNAFSSLLRAVAKLRLYTLEETQNDCT